MHRAGRTIWFVLAGWLVLAAVTACSSSAPEPHQSQATPTLAPSSAPASGNPRALARQAYLGMWQAFVAASRTADYQSASLAHYAAGDALSLLTRGLYQNYRNGIVTRAGRLSTRTSRSPPRTMPPPRRPWSTARTAPIGSITTNPGSRRPVRPRVGSAFTRGSGHSMANGR